MATANRLQLTGHPFFIAPEYRHRIRKIAAGETPPTASLLERHNLDMAGRVAIVTIDSVLVDHGSGWWGIPMDALGQLIDKLAGDPGVSAIVLNFDCPGGTTFGTPELAAKILAARSAKPVQGIANHLAASGGFWLLSACAKRFVTPSGWVGSLGVIWYHIDDSQAMENAGLRETIVRSVPHKNELASGQPLTPDALARAQEVVAAYHEMFAGNVAKNYGLPRGKVDRNFGQGRVLMAKEAKLAGMVDKIATIEDVVAPLMSRGGGSGSRSIARARIELKRKRLDIRKRSG